MRRIAATTITFFTYLIVATPAALANNLGGEGLWGETDDKVITGAGFILIAFFPLLALVLSLVQSRLERRKEARLEAEKARRERATRGGW